MPVRYLGYQSMSAAVGQQSVSAVSTRAVLLAGSSLSEQVTRVTTGIKITGCKSVIVSKITSSLLPTFTEQLTLFLPQLCELNTYYLSIFLGNKYISNSYSMALSRSKRATTGQRMTELVGKALEDDEAFYNDDIWNDEGSDSENDSYEEDSDEVKPDVFDSDFNDSEDDEDDDDDEDENKLRKSEATEKRKTGANDNKYKEPTKFVVKRKGKIFTVCLECASTCTRTGICVCVCVCVCGYK